ncbi:MAG: hypothetical protein FWG24_07380 [Eggerthellaceae bacterium]|nr:hypothetical protein [Eggerthellaceae bacterium]
MSTPQTNHADQIKKSSKAWHRTLFGLCVFVAVGALFGGGMGVLDPHSTLMGAELIVPELQKAPLVGQHIDSLLIPASTLLLFVFIPQTVASLLLFKKHPAQYYAAIICGTLLAVFTITEIALIPNPLSVLYLCFALFEITTAIICQRRTTQRQ